MTPYLSDPDVTVYVGDALSVLRELPAGSVNCCISSPPYWGLRDYGEEGQLGLERTPQEYVDKMVEVFAEVHRVLAPSGTCWLNLGDSYATQPGKGANVPQTKHPNSSYPDQAAHRSGQISGLKPKDMVGIPWRVAFALQADGWYLRSDIIWHKPNAMPESVDDRPTKSHEYLFLLTKNKSYYFDKEAVLEPYESMHSSGNLRRKHGSDVGKPGGYEGDRGRSIPWTIASEPSQQETLGDLPPEAPRGPDGRRKTSVKGTDGSIQHRDGERWPGAGRNIRSVWSIVTQPYPGAHYAVFPEELARRCILAGCPERICTVCGEPQRHIVERESSWDARREAGATRGNLASDGNVGAGTQRGVHGKGISHDLDAGAITSVIVTDCGHDSYAPGVVLDPFLGSGTTALVARKLGRHAIGIELNQSYVDTHVAVRLQQQSLFSGTR